MYLYLIENTRGKVNFTMTNNQFNEGLQLMQLQAVVSEGMALLPKTLFLTKVQLGNSGQASKGWQCVHLHKAGTEGSVAVKALYKLV